MNSKRKGNQAERELLRLLQSYGLDAHRNDQTYIGGIDNPDIQHVITFCVALKQIILLYAKNLVCPMKRRIS